MNAESLSPVLCLASASPRRRELLRQIGVPHLGVPADIDETIRVGETAQEYVLRMAREKAGCIWNDTQARNALPVLAADTVVVVDGRVVGKPRDAADARSMLAALSDRAHTVLSAVALHCGRGANLRLSISTVRLRALTSAEIDAYIGSAEPNDKAGGYAIQGLGAVFVESMSGSYSGVMGLPLFETAQLLTNAGIRVWGAVSQ